MPRTVRTGMPADGMRLRPVEPDVPPSPAEQEKRDLRAQVAQAREDAAGAAEDSSPDEDTDDSAEAPVGDDATLHVVHRGGGHYYSDYGAHYRGTHELPDGTVVHEADSERGQAILDALSED